MARRRATATLRGIAAARAFLERRGVPHHVVERDAAYSAVAEARAAAGRARGDGQERSRCTNATATGSPFARRPRASTCDARARHWVPATICEPGLADSRERPEERERAEKLPAF